MLRNSKSNNNKKKQQQPAAAAMIALCSETSERQTRVLFALRISSLPAHGLAHSLARSVLASLPGLRSSTFYSVRHVRARVRVHLRRVTADNNNASEDETAARRAAGSRRKASSAREDARARPRSSAGLSRREVVRAAYCACAETRAVIG